MPHCNNETLTKRQDVLDDLRTLSVGLDESLEQTIPTGVAFHRMCSISIIRVTEHCSHIVDAGLAAEERNILTRAYDQRTILVIVATCSLAAGINLPARRVIINGTYMGRDPVEPAMLSVCGR